ncbi:MAG: hypothetical protein ACKN95_00580, partial [Holophagaceae bacterium]
PNRDWGSDCVYMLLRLVQTCAASILSIHVVFATLCIFVIKGVSVALVNRKESQLLRSWSKRLGFQLQWRNVPDPVEVMKSKSIGLLDRIQAKITPSMLESARTLLESDTPENLIAGLLGMTEMSGVTALPSIERPLESDYKLDRKRPFRPHDKKFDRKKKFSGKPSRFKKKFSAS